MQLLSEIEAALTYNYSVEEESQDPKTIENQENKALEMASKDHWQPALALSFRPAKKIQKKLLPFSKVEAVSQVFWRFSCLIMKPKFTNFITYTNKTSIYR